jgi:hypothetical protein
VREQWEKDGRKLGGVETEDEEKSESKNKTS